MLSTYVARRPFPTGEKTISVGEEVPGAASFPQLRALVAEGWLRELPGTPRPPGPLLVANRAFPLGARQVKHGDDMDEALAWPNLRACLNQFTLRLADGVTEAHLEAELAARAASKPATPPAPVAPARQRPNRRPEARS